MSHSEYPEEVGSRPLPDEDVLHGHGEEVIHLPPLSIWPITLAAGIALAGSGLVTTFVIGIFGLVIMFIAIVGWIQELRKEHAESH